MKKLTALALATTMALSLAACGGGSKNDSGSASKSQPETTPPAASSSVGDAADFDSLGSVTLEMADATALGAAGNLLGEAIVKYADELTGGNMEIIYYPNSEMGGDAAILQYVQDGSIDLTILQTAPSATFISDVAVFDLPMVFAQYDGATIDAVLNGDGEFRTTLEKSYEDADFKLMGFMQNATYRMATTKIPLNTLADFNGLIIRTMENANHQDFWRAIGAAPTPMAWPDVYISLNQGTIHAQENAADTSANANMHEVQSYLNRTNHILYLNQVMMNNDSFNDLDPAYQAALTEAIRLAIGEVAPMLKDVENENIQKLVDGGMEVVDYEASFYQEVLELDGVVALYEKIDNDVHGLGTMLQEELAAAAG